MISYTPGWILSSDPDNARTLRVRKDHQLEKVKIGMRTILDIEEENEWLKTEVARLRMVLAKTRRRRDRARRERDKARAAFAQLEAMGISVGIFVKFLRSIQGNSINTKKDQ